jgi:hypothetical protein
MVRDPQGVNQVQGKRHVHVVRGVETGTNRAALLLSTALELAAARL